MTLNEIDKVIDPNTDVEICVLGTKFSYRGTWYEAKSRVDSGLCCENVKIRDMTIDEITTSCDFHGSSMLQIWMKR